MKSGTPALRSARRRAWPLVILTLAVAVLVPVPAAAGPRSATSCRDLELAVALDPGAAADQLIAATLCEPRNARGVQILLHGSTYDRHYWDFPSPRGPYSYVEVANRRRYATLNIDRLGHGASSHPHSSRLDWDTQAFVIHQLVGKLRSGELGIAYSRVISVGHSMGSVMAIKEAAVYEDVDALVVTGLAHGVGPGVPELVGAFYPAVADPRFSDSGLDLGYLTTRPGTRGVFYEARLSDPAILAMDEELKQTTSVAELGNLVAWRSTPAESSIARDLAIPVLIAIGGEDWLFCGGSAGLDCSSRAAVHGHEKPHYPAADLSVVVIPQTGHDVNLHRTRQLTYARVNSWIRRL